MEVVFGREITTCLALAAPVLLLTAIGQWKKNSLTLFFFDYQRPNNMFSPGPAQKPNPAEVKPLLKETTSSEGTLTGTGFQLL